MWRSLSKLSNRLTRHRLFRGNGKRRMEEMCCPVIVKTKVRGLSNCVWPRWKRTVVPDVQVGTVEASSCHRSFQVKDARSSEDAEARSSVPSGAVLTLLATSTTHPSWRRGTGCPPGLRRRSNLSPSPGSTLRRKYSWRSGRASERDSDNSAPRSRCGYPLWQFIVHVNLVLMDASQHQQRARALPRHSLCSRRALSSSRIRQVVSGRCGEFLWSPVRTTWHLAERISTVMAIRRSSEIVSRV